MNSPLPSQSCLQFPGIAVVPPSYYEFCATMEKILSRYDTINRDGIHGSKMVAGIEASHDARRNRITITFMVGYWMKNHEYLSFDRSKRDTFEFDTPEESAQIFALIPTWIQEISERRNYPLKGRYRLGDIIKRDTDQSVNVRRELTSLAQKMRV